MKRPAILGLAFIALCCCFAPSECGIADDIVEILEEFRKRMCHPIPKFGLPALDPLEIHHLEYTANNDYLIDFDGSVTDFRLTGLSDFIINEVSISYLFQRFTFDFTFPLTALKSVYTAKGSVAYIFNLAGDGDAKASVEEFRIKFTGNLNLGLNLSIRNLKILITLGGLEVYFENLIEEERINDFFHAVINELGLELLNDLWTAENAMVTEIAQTQINKILGNYSLSQIVGGSGEPIFGPDDPPGDCKDDVSAKTDIDIGTNAIDL